MRAWRAYPALARAAWKHTTAYRAVMLLALINAAFPLVMMAIWIELAREAPVAGLNPRDFVKYYAAAVIAWRLTAAGISVELEAQIRSGEIAVHLLRPLHVAHFYFVRSLINRSFASGVVLVVVAIGMWLAPEIRFDTQPIRVLLFVLACALGSLFELFTQFAIGGLAFWIGQVRGVAVAFHLVKAFLGGYVLPLTLFPLGLGAILSWMPFAVSVGLPAEILSGRLPTETALLRLMVALLWVLSAAMAAQQIWRYGVRAYSAVGG